MSVRLREGSGALAGFATFLVLAVTYALLALSSYELFGAVSIGVTFFPPAGLTFVAFLLLPRSRWPAVAAAVVVGELAVDMGKGQGLWWALGWAAANLAEPFVGAAVARALSTTVGFSRRFCLAFLVGGLLAGPAVGATVGSTVLDLGDDLAWLSSFPDIWVGDALGVLVVAPLVLVLMRPREFVLFRTTRVDVVVVAVAMVACALALVLSEEVPVGYAALPLLAYTAVRCSSRELAAAAVVVAGALTAATAHGVGPWGLIGDDLDPHSRLVQQQLFLLTAIGASWLLKLEVTERVRAVTSARDTAADLERARHETKGQERLTDLYRWRSEQATAQAELDHHIALTLQSSLMPGNVDTPAGMRASGRYLPATQTLEVGGDWYEMIHDERGTATVVIGDVVGHSLAAAAAMGQLAAAARALACAGHSPSELIESLDLVANRTPDAMMTTIACATLDAATGQLRYSSAGHPPPCLRQPDGTTVLLDGARSTPLAVQSPESRLEESTVLVPGSLVVFYTDGLVERRDRSIDERLSELERVVEGLDAHDPDGACDRIVAAMLGKDRHDDDVAILVLALDEVGPAGAGPGAAVSEAGAATG